MNYDHLNKIYQFWRKDVAPHLTHNLTVASFDEYLKRLSFLPSTRWLRDYEFIKLQRLGFGLDTKRFVKKYKDRCVTFNAPLKPEDGMQRAIYQFSPNIHAEAAFWAWLENDQIHSYVSLFVCYGNQEEYFKFSDELWKLRQEGNTEDKIAPGFAGVRAGSPLFGK